MKYRDTHESLKALYALAATQGGYFTAKQAAAAGYDYSHLAYHLEAGNFERASHGLYRLPTIPTGEHDDLIRLSLWSRDRQDEPQAVVSHASALYLVQSFVDYHNTKRRHQSLGKLPPPFQGQPPPATEGEPIEQIRRERILGGLLNHYYREAA
jgi:hypothetical protein